MRTHCTEVYKVLLLTRDKWVFCAYDELWEPLQLISPAKISIHALFSKIVIFLSLNFQLFSLKIFRIEYNSSKNAALYFMRYTVQFLYHS